MRKVIGGLLALVIVIGGLALFAAPQVGRTIDALGILDTNGCVHDEYLRGRP